MRWDEEASYAGSVAGTENHRPDRARRRLLLRGMVLGLLAVVVVIGVALGLMQARATLTLHTLQPTATLSSRDGVMSG